MGPRAKSRGTRRWLIAGLVLPALLLRAAIPAGLMPVFDAHGGFALQLCPGISGAHASHHHAHADHTGSQGRGDTSTGAHGALCPFALSAGPALAGTFVHELESVVVATFVPDDATSVAAVTTILRAQFARGPPFPHWT